MALKHNQPPLLTNKEQLPISKPNHPVIPPCTERGAPPAEFQLDTGNRAEHAESTQQEPKRVDQIFLT